MDRNIAVITVPLEEWEDIKKQLQFIANAVLEMKSKRGRELLTPKEAMEVLKCSRNTLQGYFDKDYLKPLKMDNKKYSKVLVRRSDIDLLLKKHS